MSQNERGFTLIELLMTLMIIAMMMLFIVPQLINLYEKQIEKQFLTVLEQDFLMLQNSSFQNYDYNRIIFREDSYSLSFAFDSSRQIRREYPKNMTINYNNTNIINFNYKGTIVNPGTLTIRSKHMNKKLVFPFGKGRFYVAE